MVGNPSRDRSRYPSEGPADRPCPVCDRPVGSSRATFCSATCKQRAWRLRHLRVPDLDRVSHDLRRRGQLTGASVYECPRCQARMLGERRCAECNLMGRRVGLGAECPHCSEVVVIEELLA